VDQHATPSKLGCHSPVAITPTMFQHDPLNLGSDFHVFIHRHFFFKGTVETRSTHLADLAHPLDTQTALHRHQLSTSDIGQWEKWKPTICRRELFRILRCTGDSLASRGRASWFQQFSMVWLRVFPPNKSSTIIPPYRPWIHSKLAARCDDSRTECTTD